MLRTALPTLADSATYRAGEAAKLTDDVAQITSYLMCICQPYASRVAYARNLLQEMFVV
jgi:hypothetical protein